MKADYNQKNIETLKWNEAIRKRPGMYLGFVNHRGLIGTIKDLFSFILTTTETNLVTIEFKNDISFSIKLDNFNAVLHKNLPTIPAPYDFKSLAFPTINALSATFKIKYYQKGNGIIEQLFQKGDLIKGIVNDEPILCQSIEIDFTLDKEIWGDFQNELNFMLHEIQDFAYLNHKTKFKLYYQIEGNSCQNIYHFKNGLKDRINIEKWKGLGTSYFETHFKKKLDTDFFVEIAFAFRDYSVDESFLKSYLNDYYTYEHGTHVDGLLKGIRNGVIKYLQKNSSIEKYGISEKKIKEILIAAIHIKIEHPKYYGSTRNKLASPEIIEPIATLVENILFEKMKNNEADAKKLIRDFEIF